jgi:hypothetical protein
MTLQEAAELLSISVSELVRMARERDTLPHLISLAYNKGIEEASTQTHEYYRKIVEPRERQLDESRDKLYALTKPK